MNNQIPLRVKVKNLLKEILPRGLFELVSSLWIKTGSRLFNVQGVLEKYTEDFLSKNPRIVQSGPFSGMKYVDKAIGSNYLHKLIGSYEAVLHPTIEKIKKINFDTIIDVGSAEGYYLVGLGRIMPRVRLIGFEIEETGRSLAKEMYETNNLNNELNLEGEANASNVTRFITDDTLFICDCEGAEIEILDTDNYPIYKKIKFAIIEMHDFIKPNIKETLINRFSGTHRVEVIKFKTANPENYKFLSEIKDKNELYEISRERGCQDQEWLILERLD